MSPKTSTPLTLIVAATHPHMGIGRASALPWPSLKAEMAYFARVTRRCPSNTWQLVPKGQAESRQEGQCINAVVMGRKTWESIPERWRPLKGRINVVVSRRPDSLGFGREMADEKDVLEREQGAKAEKVGPYVVASLEEGMELLERLYPVQEEHTNNSTDVRDTVSIDRPQSTIYSLSSALQWSSTKSLSRVYVIGGAEIYTTALKMPSCARILLTRVYTEFVCDKYFPLKLDPESNGTVGDGEWVKMSKSELDEWVGEDVPAGRQRQEDVEWEYEMWERERSG